MSGSLRLRVAGGIVLATCLLLLLLMIPAPKGDRAPATQPARNPSPARPHVATPAIASVAPPPAADASPLTESAAPPAAPSPQIDESAARRSEARALRTLASLLDAQRHFVAMKAVDEDGDGTGEYGFISELVGVAAPRGKDRPINPPLLSAAFRNLDAEGRAEIGGYLFSVHLPALAGRVDPDQAETSWVAYAWPVKPGEGGRLTYVATSDGAVRSSERARSREAPPAADEFDAASPAGWTEVDSLDATFLLLAEGEPAERTAIARAIGIAARRKALGDRAGDAQAALIAAAGHEDAAIRAAAAGALASFGGEEVLEALIGLLDDESDAVIEAAAASLGALGEQAAVARRPLELLLTGSPPAPRVRTAVERALDRIPR